MRYTREHARIVYMGTPEISATVFEGMLEAGFQIVAVITNPDKPSGRGSEVRFSPVKTLALAHDIPVYQPEKIRLDHAFLADLNPDVIVTMAYGQIVPQEVLDCPKKGCINLHGSLLPALRGAAPIQRALDLGLTKTGVTLMEMVKAMDAGRMYDAKEVDITPEDNYTSLAKKIAIAAKELIAKDLLPYLNDELPGVPQDEAQVTFANKITPEDEHLSVSMPRSDFLNRIRALSETPGGYLLLQGKKLKILRAHPAEGFEGPLGCVVKAKKGFVFMVSGGAVEADFVLYEGKKAMDGKSFVNGMRDLLGTILE